MNREPTTEQWYILFDLAARIKKLAPWDWMYEDDVVAVQHPMSGEFGYISVMGNAGEYFAVGVYLGAEGLTGFKKLRKRKGNPDPERVLSVPQIQLAFDDREVLSPQEYALIKRLGLKFRGRNAWPNFRSYHAGFVPWMVKEEESVFLTIVLEQLLDVAPRLRQNRTLVKSVDKKPPYFTRVPRFEGDNLVWEDQMLDPPKASKKEVDVRWDEDLLFKLQQKPLQKRHIEADFFKMARPIQETGQPPYYAHVLLLVDAKSGVVLGQELMQPFPSYEEMLAQIPQNFLKQLARHASLPTQVNVTNPLLAHLLEMLTPHLKFHVNQVQFSPFLSEIRTMLSHF